MTATCRLFLAISLLALGACSHSPDRGDKPGKPNVVIDSLPLGHPTVQVRDRKNSPEIMVMAWDPIDNRYGLLGRYNRNGELRSHDHIFFVRTYYVPSVRVMPRVTANNSVLRIAPVMDDPYNCSWGPCSPPEITGAFVSDRMLRSLNDSLEVHLLDESHDVTLLLTRDVIRAYLQKVDSLVRFLESHKN